MIQKLANENDFNCLYEHKTSKADLHCPVYQKSLRNSQDASSSIINKNEKKKSH